MTPEQIETLTLERDYWRLIARDIPAARDALYESLRKQMYQESENRKTKWHGLILRSREMRDELLARGAEL